MPRTCTVCMSAHRDAIDAALVRRVPYRNIVERFSVSQGSLSRHLNEHLAEYVQQALSEYGTAKGVKVLDKLTGTLGRLEAFLDAAEEARDAREFVVVAAELRKELELIAKLQGELAQEGTTNILVHPEYVEVRALIVQALEPFPEAQDAGVRALGDGGDG